MFAEAPLWETDQSQAEVPWALHSPDLSPLDFMLWGHLKSRTHEKKPARIQELEAAIREEMGRVAVAMVDRTIQPAPPASRLPQILD